MLCQCPKLTPLQSRLLASVTALALLGLLYWSLSNLAAQTEQWPRVGVPRFAFWLMSSAPSARAIRAGVADYLRRRFGKAADSFRDRLSSDEKHYAKLVESRAGR